LHRAKKPESLQKLTGKKLRFGCLSLKNIQYWHDEADLLDNSDFDYDSYHVSVYRVPRKFVKLHPRKKVPITYLYEAQELIFDAAKAKKIGKLCVKEALKILTKG
jgi:hypothetical protein